MFTGLGGFGSNDIVAFVGVAGISEFNKAMTQLGADADAAARRVDKAMSMIAAAGAAAFGTAIAAAAQFEKGMQNVRSLITVSDDDFAKLSREVLDFAQSTSKKIPDITKALYDLYSSGVKVEDGLGALKQASAASAAGLTSLTTAVNAGMAAANAYGDRLEVLGGLSERLSYIYDVQFETVRVGVLTYEQLANAIGNVLPSAVTLGASLEEMHGALAHLTRSGIDAQSAATYLARAFQNLVSERERFEQFGVEIFDKHTGAFRGLVPVMADLHKKLENMTDAERMAALEMLHLDLRAAKAIYSMIGNWSMFQNIMADVADNVGAMGKAHEQNTRTFEREAGVLKNQLQVAFIELGTGPKEALRVLLHEINKHPEAVGAVVKSMSTAVITAGALAAAYKSVQLAGSALRGINALMATSFGPVGLAIAGVATALGILKAAIDAHDTAERRHREELIATVTRLNEVAQRHDELASKKEKTRLEAVALQRSESELREMLAKLGVQVDSNVTSFSKLADAMRVDTVKAMQTEIEKLSARAAELDLTAQGLAASTNGIAGLFAQWLARRDEKKIKELQDAVAQLDGATMSYSKTQELLNAAGIKTREQIELQIRALENLLRSTHLEVGQRQQIESELSKQREELEKLISGEREATRVSLARRDALKELNDAGIQTTAQINAEIARLRELLPYVREDDLARGQLIEKIRELQREKNVLAQKYNLEVDSLGFLVPKQLEAVAGSARYAQSLQLVTVESQEAAKETVQLTTVADRVAAAFGTTKENLAEWASLLRNIVGDIPGAESGFGKFAQSLVTWASSGFNPIVGLGELASNVLGRLREQTHEPFQVKIETLGFPEFMQKSELLIHRIEEINRALAAQQGIPGSLDALREYIRSIIELTGEAKQFEAFLEYEETVRNFGEALEYAHRVFDLFGAGATQNAGAIQALNTYIEQASRLLATLPAGSAAWAEVNRMIAEARDLLAQLSGEARSTASAFQDIRESARSQAVSEYDRSLKLLLESWKSFSSEYEKFGFALRATQDNFSSALDAAAAYFSNLALIAPHSQAWYEFGQQLSQVYNEYLRLTGAVVENETALKAEGIVLGDAIDYMGRLGEANLGAGAASRRFADDTSAAAHSTDSLREVVKRLGDDFDALPAKVTESASRVSHSIGSLHMLLRDLGDDFDALPAKVNEAANAVTEIGNIFTRTADDVWRLDDALRGFYGYQSAQLTQFLRDVVNAEKMVAEMQRVGATFATTDVDERLREMIARMQELLATIPPTATGHWDLVRAIARLRELLGESLSPLHDVVQATHDDDVETKKLASTVSTVTDRLVPLHDIVRQVDDDLGTTKLTRTVETVTDHFVSLRDVVKRAGDDFDALSRKSEAVAIEEKISAITTALAALMPRFEEARAAQEAFYNEYKSRMAEIAQKQDQVRDLQGQINKLLGVVPAGAWHELRVAIDEAVGSIREFFFELPSGLRETKTYWDVYQREYKALSDIIEQIKYFGWDIKDLYGTDMLQQIALYWNELQSFLDTLTPGSQAAADLTEQIGNLLMVLGDLGITPGLLQNLGIEGAKSEVEGLNQSVQSELQSLLDWAAQQRLELQTNFGEVIAQVQELRRQLEELLDTRAALQLTSEGGGFHSGGLVKAHSGLYAWDEIPAVLKRGEYVVRAEAVRAVGVETLNAINRGQVPSAPSFSVVIHEATPRTWAEIVQEHIAAPVTVRQKRARVL